MVGPRPEAKDQGEVDAGRDEAGAGDRDQVRQPPGGNAAAVEGAARRLQGQRRGQGGIVIHALAGRRTALAGDAARHERRAGVIGALEHVADDVGTEGELPGLDAGALIHRGQPGRLLVRRTAQRPGDFEGVRLGKDRVRHRSADAEDGEGHNRSSVVRGP